MLNTIVAQDIESHIRQLRERVNGRDAFVEGVHCDSFKAVLRMAEAMATAIGAGLVEDGKAIGLISRSPLHVPAIAIAALYADRGVLILSPDLSDKACLRHLHAAEAGLVIADGPVLLRDSIRTGPWERLCVRRSRFGGTAASAEPLDRALRRMSGAVNGKTVEVREDRPNLWFAVDDDTQIGFSLRNVQATVGALVDTFAIAPGTCIGVEQDFLGIPGFFLGPMACLFVGARWLPGMVAKAESLSPYLGAIDRWQINQYFMAGESLAACAAVAKLYDDSFATSDLRGITVLADPLADRTDEAAFCDKFHRSVARAVTVDAMGGIAFLDRGEGKEGAALGEPVGCDATVAANGQAAGPVLVGGPRLGTIRSVASADRPANYVGDRLRTPYVGFRSPTGRFLLAKATNTQEQAPQEDNIAQMVYSSAAEVFKVDPGILGPDSDGENTPGWTSLTSVELVLLLEERFEIAFVPREIMNMITLGDVIDACRQKKSEHNG